MSFLHPLIADSLVDEVTGGVPARRHGIHGLPHWQRVERNGLFLAASTGGDSHVVSLFALFHDSRRLNDGVDPGHGARGGRFAQELFHSGRLDMDEDQIGILVYACDNHTDEHFSSNPTIACCWDADRLDLPRVGILPDPAFLNTQEAKQIAISSDYSVIENSEITFSRE